MSEKSIDRYQLTWGSCIGGEVKLSEVWKPDCLAETAGAE